MDYESGMDILKLVELLQPPAEPVKPEDDLPGAGYNIEENCEAKKRDNIKIEKTKPPRTIEEYEQQLDKELSEIPFDTRKVPIFDIKYRQAVTPEDIYLQMGAKTPATASCEDMIITIKLVEESFPSLELSVTKSDIKLSGFSHKLDLPLPQPINPDLSKASWNQEDETLILTLRMEREFDFVNF